MNFGGGKTTVLIHSLHGSIRGPLLWVCFTCDQPDPIHDHLVVGHDLNRGCGVQDMGMYGVDSGEERMTI